MADPNILSGAGFPAKTALINSLIAAIRIADSLAALQNANTPIRHLTYALNESLTSSDLAAAGLLPDPTMRHFSVDAYMKQAKNILTRQNATEIRRLYQRMVETPRLFSNEQIGAIRTLVNWLDSAATESFSFGTNVGKNVNQLISSLVGGVYT